MTSNYEERFQSICKSLTDSSNNLNIDSLLDSVSALVYETNTQKTSAQKNYENLVNKFLPSVKIIESQRVNKTDFKVIKMLGRGAFGEVSLVRHISSNKIFALKSLNKAEMVKRGDAACLWEERDIMALSNSDWIVKLFYAFQDNIYLYMVMEFMQGGDMVNFMSSYDPDEKQAKFYIAELCLALNDLHNIGYIHRDVKPDNMLIDGKGHLKICDFGTCIKMGKDGKVIASLAVGTPDYICPEILKSQNNATSYGVETDWWSVGIFLYEFMVGETPFYSDSLKETYQKILSYKTSLVFPKDVSLSKEIIDLIQKFITDANVRYGKNGLAEIQNHPFFKDKPWTWENIRKSKPPIVPEFSDPEDTSNFDEISIKDSEETVINTSNQPFSGHHLAYIGFSYTNYTKLLNQNLTSSKTKTDAKDDQVRENLFEEISKKLEDSKATINKLEMDKIQLLELGKELKKKLEESATFRAKNDSKVNAFAKGIALSEQKLNEANRRIIDQTNKISELEQQIKIYSNDLNINSKYKEEVFKVTNKLKIAENEIQEQLEKLNISESQLRNLKISEAELKKCNQDLNSDYAKLKILSDEHNELFAKIENANKDLNNELNLIKDSYSTLNTEYCQLKSHHSILNTEVDSIKILFEASNLFQLKDQLISLKDNNSSLQKQLNQYELEIKKHEQQEKENPNTYNSEFLNLQTRYNLIISERDLLKSKSIESEARQAILSAKCHDLSETLQMLTNENVVKTSQIQDLTSKLNAALLIESNLTKEREELFKKQRTLEDSVHNLEESFIAADKKVIDLLEKIESQEAYYKMHKTQIDDLKEDLKESEIRAIDLENKITNFSKLNDELKSQISSKDKSIAALQTKKLKLQEKVNVLTCDLEGLSAMFKTLEITSQSNESPATIAAVQLQSLTEKISDNQSNLNCKESELSESISKINKLTEEINSLKTTMNSNMIQHKRALEQEKMLKDEAIKKLEIVMDSKLYPALGGDKERANGKVKKLERLNKQYELQLKQDQDKYEKLIKDNEKKISELKDVISELNTRLHESTNRANSNGSNKNGGLSHTSSTVSKSSGFAISEILNNSLLNNSEELIKETFLWIPYKNKKLSRKMNWQKTIAVINKTSFTLYKDEEAKNKSNPMLLIYIRLIFHVRAVSQNDLIHADPKHIDRIFQILYSDDSSAPPSASSERKKMDSNVMMVSSHRFIDDKRKIPSTCSLCGKGMWGSIISPAVVECQNCHYHCHKSHLNSDTIPECKLNDSKNLAKEIVLMCSTSKEQESWIHLILKLLLKIGNENNDDPSNFKPLAINTNENQRQQVSLNVSNSPATNTNESINEQVSHNPLNNHDLTPNSLLKNSVPVIRRIRNPSDRNKDMPEKSTQTKYISLHIENDDISALPTIEEDCNCLKESAAPSKNSIWTRNRAKR